MRVVFHVYFSSGVIDNAVMAGCGFILRFVLERLLVVSCCLADYMYVLSLSSQMSYPVVFCNAKPMAVITRVLTL